MSDSTVHFHSGSNLAGYSPEGDIACSETWTEARDALVRILDRDAEACGDHCSGNEELDGCESCSALADMERIVQWLKENGCSANFLDYATEGSRTLAYWITLVPASECTVESD